MSDWGDLALDAVPFVAAASHRGRAAVLERSQLVTYSRGDVIFQEGDPPTHLHVISRGAVEVIDVLPDGSEEVLRRLGRGQLLGELGILGGHSRSASARAAEDCRIWKIEREAFLEIYETEQAVALELAQVMAQYMLDAPEAAEDLLFLDLRGRLAKRLIFLTEVAGSNVVRAVGTEGMSKEQVEETLRHAAQSGQIEAGSFGQLDRLAMLAGGTRRSVAQLLSEMQAAGLLVIAEGNIIILSEDDLLAASQHA